MTAPKNTGKLAVLALFGIAVLGVFAFLFLRGGSEGAAGGGAASAAGRSPDVEVTLRFVYSTEKKTWMQAALAQFQRANPEIGVEPVEMGSLEAVRAIVDGQEKPALWSPADHVALNLAAADWKQKSGTELIAESGSDQPLPLVLTPLVFVAWEDRGKVLDNTGTGITWKRLHEALSATEGWPAIGGPAEWGFVKLGHTNPTTSNSGLQALILMAYDFHGKRGDLAIGDALQPQFQEYVKAIEKGVPQFGDSTGTFTEQMVLYGPSKYDVVVTYENLAIQHLPNAQGRWGNLRIYYPAQTMWSSHPVALLRGDWVTADQQKAARKLIDFLRSREIQLAALQLGFRPGNAEVPMVQQGVESPFDRAKPFGVRLDITTVVEPPPGPVIRNLMEMWSRLIGRR